MNYKTYICAEVGRKSSLPKPYYPNIQYEKIFYPTPAGAGRMYLSASPAYLAIRKRQVQDCPVYRPALDAAVRQMCRDGKNHPQRPATGKTRRSRPHRRHHLRTARAGRMEAPYPHLRRRKDAVHRNDGQPRCRVSGQAHHIQPAHRFGILCGQCRTGGRERLRQLCRTHLRSRQPSARGTVLHGLKRRAARPHVRTLRLVPFQPDSVVPQHQCPSG